MTDLAATLKTLQAYLREKKAAFERGRDLFDDIPAPDPAELLDGRPRGPEGMSALYTLSKIEQARIENDIQVFDTAVQALDRAIMLAEAGRDDEASEFFAAFPVLMRQLSPAPRTDPGRSA